MKIAAKLPEKRLSNLPLGIFHFALRGGQKQKGERNSTQSGENNKKSLYIGTDFYKVKSHEIITKKIT